MDNNYDDVFTQTENGVDLNVNQIKANCLESNNGTFSLDTNGNLVVNSITSNVLIDVDNILNKVYPVGSIYMSFNSTNPSDLFGGVWEQIKDRFLLSAGNIYENGSLGGEASHTLTIDEMPSHRHLLKYSGYDVASGSTTCPKTNEAGRTHSSLYEGGNNPHNNMPPYLVVFMYKRIS